MNGDYFMIFGFNHKNSYGGYDLFYTQSEIVPKIRSGDKVYIKDQTRTV